MSSTNEAIEDFVASHAVIIRFPKRADGKVASIKCGEFGTPDEYRDALVNNPKLIMHLELGEKNGDEQCKIDLAYIKLRAQE